MRFAIVLLFMPSLAAAAGYNVAASTAYAQNWWLTTTPPYSRFKPIIRVNSSRASPPGPYTYYYECAAGGVTCPNDGDGNVIADDGEDCTNFASQILQAGGITFTTGTVVPYWGRNNTLVRVREMNGTIRSIASATKLMRSTADAPDWLSPGDIVIWGNRHTTFVVSGNGSGVTLAAHTFDTNVGTLSQYFARIALWNWARAFDLSSVSVTTATTASDSTPPFLTRRNYQGSLIPDGGWANGQLVTAEVSDSGSGVDSLDATTPTTIMDTEVDAALGIASYVMSDPTFYGASHTYSVSLNFLSDGTTVYLQAYDASGNVDVSSFRIDRVAPSLVSITDIADNPITYATSSTTVKITGTDALSGTYTITISSSGGAPQVSTNSTPAPNVPYTATFSGLTDGSYAITIADKANNSASGTFSIDTSNPGSPGGGGNTSTGGGFGPGGTITSTECVIVRATQPIAGISSLELASGGSISSATFSCDPVSRSTSAVFGPGCVGVGTSTITRRSCSGTSSSMNFNVVTGTRTLKVCYGADCASSNGDGAPGKTRLTMTGQGLGGSPGLDFCDAVVLTPRTYCHGTGVYETGYEAPCGQSFSFSVYNSTNTQWLLTNTVGGNGSGTSVTLPEGFPAAGATITGALTITENEAVCPSSSTAAPGFTLWSPLLDLVNQAASYVGAFLRAANMKNLAYFPGSLINSHGSDAAFASAGAVSYSLASPTSISVSTPTLAVYRWDGADWSSAPITSQYIHKDTGSGVITATGTVFQSGYYALFFAGSDSSAPITSPSFQGSTRAFAGDVFVSTDAYLVLTSTDLTINGYASNVATTYYRIDATTASPSFSVYTTSIPLSLGFHIVDYRAIDWAGNWEQVKTSTFLVTAGTLFKASSRLVSKGSALIGFLDSGAQLEVESRAENSLTLSVSSVNTNSMLAVDNIGNVGVGAAAPAARLDVQGSGAGTAISLRSGNSIASTSSVQIAFGYNGEASMRHALVTTHSTDTVGNRMDFYIWNALAPSTSAVASMDLLALQVSTNASGGVFHVRPVGNPIGGVELIVSDGVTPGAGKVVRGDVIQGSSRRVKSDIAYLSLKEEQAASRDVLALKHVRFNYKSEPLGARAHTGILFEEAPMSVRGPGNSVSLDDRLNNAEMSFKEALRRIAAINARLEALEAPR